jgi:hypothetical protein
VPLLEQSSQGGMLRTFYERYGIRPGDRFAVRVVP